MGYGYDRQQLAAIARGENPDAPRVTAEPTATLDDVLAGVKWDLSDRSRDIVRLVLDGAQSPADTAAAVAMCLAGLEYERFAAQDAKRRIAEQCTADETPTRLMVARLWKLYDHRRKTVSMQALHAALEGRES